eukprot:scaffold61535_cov22-Tisochrysis_lutea.AAC.1
MSLLSLPCPGAASRLTRTREQDALPRRGAGAGHSRAGLGVHPVDPVHLADEAAHPVCEHGGLLFQCHYK